MAQVEKRYWYLARKESVESLEVHDIMELLRYDAARVECNPPSGFYLMSKLQTGGYQEPSVAHWKSFGVRIYIYGVRQHQPTAEECLNLVRAEDTISPSKGGVR